MTTKNHLPQFQISIILLVVILVLTSSRNLYAQDTLVWNEIKGRIIINKIDQILQQTAKLKQTTPSAGSDLNLALDTIIQEATKFKMALRRRNKYAEQFADDFSYYYDQLKSSSSLTGPDSLFNLINEVKTDMLLKTQMGENLIDTAIGPGGSDDNYRLVNFKVRVANNDTTGLQGFEIFIKKGILFPSKDSVRIPQLTDHAVAQIAPGNFTIVAWKGNQFGKAAVQVYRKPEFICEVKLKQ